MNEHIESAPPRPAPKNRQLEQLEAALAAAQLHLEWIRNSCKSPSRPMALRKQEGIVKQYQRQIAELTEDDWI